NPIQRAFWMLLAALLLLSLWDLMSLRKLPTLSLTREIPFTLSHQTPVKVQLTLGPRPNWMKEISLYDFYQDSVLTQGLPIQVPTDTQHTYQLNYRLTPLKRGELNFSGVEMEIKTPLKFFRLITFQKLAQVSQVYPNFSMLPSLSLLSQPKAHVSGLRLSRQRGSGMEFQELKEYEWGEDLRHIDWKASSKSPTKLFSRVYQEEQGQQVFFLLDCGRRMRNEDHDFSLLDLSLNAMIMLSYIALKSGDQVGFLSYGGISRYQKPLRGVGQLPKLLKSLYDLEPTFEASDFLEASRELKKHLQKRSLLVILSNLRDEEAPEIQMALKLLGKHHLVLLANLQEPGLGNLLKRPIQKVEEAWTLVAAQFYQKNRQKLLQNLRHQGIHCLDCEASQLALLLSQKYLDLKGQKLI
ncbi:MAG: DUF58 domain-containing protein, partial [Deltaproteobacteria bacterium]|nr:DUF58 domain-containing protein [Deltaproteobacteria bacterium]